MEDKITRQLEQRRIKPTAMRQLVLKVLTDSKTAVGLPDLEKAFDKADKATLYRTLKTFEANKLVHKIDDGSGVVKYALCSESCQCEPEDLHVHFHCNVCGHTYCLHDISIPAISLPAGFSLENVNMVVKGVCSECRMA